MYTTSILEHKTSDTLEETIVTDTQEIDDHLERKLYFFEEKIQYVQKMFICALKFDA